MNVVNLRRALLGVPCHLPASPTAPAFLSVIWQCATDLSAFPNPLSPTPRLGGGPPMAPASGLKHSPLLIGRQPPGPCDMAPALKRRSEPYFRSDTYKACEQSRYGDFSTHNGLFSTELKRLHSIKNRDSITKCVISPLSLTLRNSSS